MIAIRILRVVGKAVGLTAVGGFLFAGIFAAPLPRQAAETQSSAPARTSQPAGEAVPVSVPRLVQFNGTLKDAAARPLAGVASVTFAIYAEQDGGTALWSETQNVLADPNGHYNVLLGSATAAGVPAELFGTGQSRWLGVTVGRQQEMSRILLASVPYALKAADAETLGGLPASAYVTTQSLAARSATLGSTTILTTPQIAAPSSAGTGAATNAALPQATPTGSGTTNFIPLWTSSSALGNSLLFQTGGKIGVGTTTPTETLDVNGNSVFRGSFQLPPGHDATSSSGFESHSFQFQASSFNSSTKASTTQSFGFRAEPLNNNTTNPSAQLDLFFIPNGGSEFVNTGVSWSSTGIMTFAPGQTFPGSTTVTELSLPNTTSSSNGVITFGGRTFLSDSGATTNTFVGGGAGGTGEVSGSSDSNTGVGNGALASNKTGINNTATGASALQAATSASYNSAFGVQALNFELTGGSNTAVGYASGFTDQSGAFNTFIGANADASTTNLTHATAIGAGAIVGESNAIVLGGTGQSAVNVGIGTTTPISALELSSGIDTTALSSAPNPSLTLTNTAGGLNSRVSIDFNTSARSSAGTYNPGASIVAEDGGAFQDFLVFYTNNQTADRPNAGLFKTMVIAPDGSVTITNDLTVKGTVTKMGGSFKIDDPIDPGAKYLSHSFVESPDMMNIYNGNVVTNAKGYAMVTMPAWFEALNRDFRYQLTPVGQFSQAMIASEIKDRKFIIRTSKPHVKVSWMVTGIRQDAWANAHRIPTEEEKPANEQGHYLHPELFGAGPDREVGATPVRAASDSRSAAPAPGGAQ
jgi:trimeric autotransporter adhesin